jgi:hypothetical protein
MPSGNRMTAICNLQKGCAGRRAIADEFDRVKAIPPRQPLWRFSSERRRYERHVLAAPVRLHGPQGVLAAKTVDVSASGVLLRVHAPRSPEVPTPPPADPPPLESLRELFGTAFQLQFEEHEVAARARLVRVSRATDDPDTLLVGCEFALNLHERQLERLGVNPRVRSAKEERPASILPLDVRDDAPVEVRVHDRPAEDPEIPGEPLCEGRLVGLGGPVLAAKVSPEAPPRMAARLDGRRLAVRVVHDDEVIWSVGARLLSVRLLPSRPPTAEVALLAEREPSPDVSQRFRHVRQ